MIMKQGKEKKWKNITVKNAATPGTQGLKKPLLLALIVTAGYTMVRSRMNAKCQRNKL